MKGGRREGGYAGPLSGEARQKQYGGWILRTLTLVLCLSVQSSSSRPTSASVKLETSPCVNGYKRIRVGEAAIYSPDWVCVPGRIKKC